MIFDDTEVETVKKLLSILLILSLLMSLAACGGEGPGEVPHGGGADPGLVTPPADDSTQSDEPDGPSVTPPESGPDEPAEPVFPFPGDEELLLAWNAGFVPAELWVDAEDVISLADLCGMVDAIVAGTDSAQEPAFAAAMGAASTFTGDADRCLAAIVFYYAAHVLELPEVTCFSLGTRSDCYRTHGMELNNVIGTKCWDEMDIFWDDPGFEGVFPLADEGGDSCDGHWDDIRAAAYFALLNRSTYDGRLLFDYDGAENTMHMDSPVTKKDAIRAAARFFEMCHAEEFFSQSMRDVNGASVHKTPIGEYDTAELIGDLAVGIHFSQCHTDWLDFDRGGIEGYDSFYDLMLGEWANVMVSRDNLKGILRAYREAGFNTVRMPVTWLHYVDDGTYEIDPGFLDYVEYLVNLILDEGMYCIINSHRDYAALDAGLAYVDGRFVGDWMKPEYTPTVNARYTAIWRQVAERFRDYGDHLIFEALNEPMETIPSVGPDLDRQVSRVNELDRLFVDTVRATGGNNAVRTLVVNCLCGSYFLDTLIPPEDNHIAAAYHSYFTNSGGLGMFDLPMDTVPVDENNNFTSWSRDNSALRGYVEKVFSQMEDFRQRTGVPVILGETGVSSALSEEDNIEMMTFILLTAKSLGIPAILWDSYVGDETGDDVGLYVLGRDEWRTPALIDAVMEASGA